MMYRWLGNCRKRDPNEDMMQRGHDAVNTQQGPHPLGVVPTVQTLARTIMNMGDQSVSSVLNCPNQTTQVGFGSLVLEPNRPQTLPHIEPKPTKKLR